MKKNNLKIMSNNVLRNIRQMLIFGWLWCSIMLFLKYTKEKYEGESVNMLLDDKICKLREKLNNCISNGEDYSVIYKVSVELDELIAQYYARAAEVGNL